MCRNQVARVVCLGLFVALVGCESSSPAPSPDVAVADAGWSLASDTGVGDGGFPSVAQCAMDGTTVDCSIAVWDVALAGAYGQAAGAVANATPRKVCETVCGATAGGEFPNITASLYDKLACHHTTSIKGLSCDACLTLSDQVVTELWCDTDPCTRDWCSGTSCHHEPWGWIGEACAAPGPGSCKGSLKCNPSACPSGGLCTDLVLKQCDSATTRSDGGGCK